MKINKGRILRAIGSFFALMIFFTVVGGRINEMMTTEVATTSTTANELQININQNAVIDNGYVYFTLNMEKEMLLQVGDSLDVELLGEGTRVRAVVIEKEFNAAVQEMGFRCELWEGETIFYEGQLCRVGFAYSLGTFNQVLPRECLFYEGNEAFVYYVETLDTALGKQSTVQKLMVNILEEDEFGAAVAGNIHERYLIVRYATKPLEEGQRVRIGL